MATIAYGENQAVNEHEPSGPSSRVNRFGEFIVVLWLAFIGAKLRTADA